MDSRVVAPASIEIDAERRISIAFLNWAHALDHFVMLIFPTVVIGLEIVYARPYSELIVLATDPHTLTPAEVENLAIDLTIVGGHVIYERGRPAVAQSDIANLYSP